MTIYLIGYFLALLSCGVVIYLKYKESNRYTVNDLVLNILISLFFSILSFITVAVLVAILYKVELKDIDLKKPKNNP